MRSSLGRGLLLTAFAGTFMLAAGPAALAATTPATTSPEAMSLDATGTIPIGPIGNAPPTAEQARQRLARRFERDR